MAAAREELDPVVGHRIVARREHHAEVGLELGSQERDRRCREDTKPQDVDARTCEAGDDRCFEELTRCPRVTADDGERSVAFERAGLTKHVRSGDRKLEGELGGQLLVRNAADTVSSEQPDA